MTATNNAPAFCRRSRSDRITLRAFGWALIATALCLPHAYAQDTQQAPAADESTQYHAIVDEALREFDTQHFEEARSLFLQAHALSPNARTHRALGLVEFELRNYVESAQQLELALASDSKRLADQMRRDAETMLRRAYGFVGRVAVTIRPANAVLTLDGKELDQAAGAPLLLPIGEHTLHASARDFEPLKRTLGIKGGEKLVLGLALVPVGPTRELAPDAGRTSGRRWYKSPWLWSCVAIVIVGAAAGTAYALARNPAEPRIDRGSSGILVHGP